MANLGLTEDEWTSIRVRAATNSRLQAFAARKLKLVQAGRLEAEGQVRYGRLSADAALSLLLSWAEKEYARRKK